MAALYTKNVIVCGLAAQRVNIVSRNESIDCATWDDPLASIALPPVHTADFEFAHLSNAEIVIAKQRFPVGSGTPFQGHDLGPADVCQYCGTAWLPGTLRCPSCGGRTDHAERAIEYAARQAGRIVETQLTMPMDGFAVFRVKAEFTALAWTAGIETMFRHSLWHTEAALWICRFCGHMVHGYTADCPGCGGKRAAIDALATQQRECLWCGAQMIGGYACPMCNMRLRAQLHKRED